MKISFSLFFYFSHSLHYFIVLGKNTTVTTGTSLDSVPDSTTPKNLGLTAYLVTYQNVMCHMSQQQKDSQR